VVVSKITDGTHMAAALFAKPTMRLKLNCELVFASVVDTSVTILLPLIPIPISTSLDEDECGRMDDAVSIIGFRLRLVSVNKFTKCVCAYPLILTYSKVQDIILKADCHSACQKISCFLYGTRRFITMLTKARQWTLS
jgi:hypothetical protein